MKHPDLYERRERLRQTLAEVGRGIEASHHHPIIYTISIQPMPWDRYSVAYASENDNYAGLTPRIVGAAVLRWPPERRRHVSGGR